MTEVSIQRTDWGLILYLPDGSEVGWPKVEWVGLTPEGDVYFTDDGGGVFCKATPDLVRHLEFLATIEVLRETEPKREGDFVCDREWTSTDKWRPVYPDNSLAFDEWLRKN